MNLVHIVTLAVIVNNCLCKIDASNEVSPKLAALDTSLRKALLKALTELEDEEKSRVNFPALGLYSDKAVEKASASALTVYTTNTENFSTTPAIKEPPSEKPVVLVQKSNSVQHKPIISFIPSEAEQFEASASSSFTLPNRKTEVTAKSVSSSSNLLSATDKFANAIRSVTAKTELTSPAPTVASPTTEENEAKVEDVQFFTAPLVAAFTVHQDEHGLPKSVEPIFKQSAQIPVRTSFHDGQKLKQQQVLKQEQYKQEQLRNQLALQEKQRSLEEQLFKLQQQQKQQQEYLIKQQQLLQDQDLKLRNRKLSEERARVQQNEQPFSPITSPSNTHFNNHLASNDVTGQFNNNQFSDLQSNHFAQPLNNQLGSQNQAGSQSQIGSQSQTGSQSQLVSQSQLGSQNQANPQGNRGAIVSFQSSVSLTPAEQLNKGNELPFNARNLPIRNPVNFHQSPYVHPVLLNTIQPVAILTPPHIPAVQHLGFTQNLDLPVLPQRIFRREPLTGNFVSQDLNGNRLVYNNFGLQPHLQTPVQASNVRLLRSNLESYQTSPGFPIQPPVVNQHLNNLLYNSGIARGKQFEDLNIISKVLSYNHVGGDNFFSGSRLSEQRLLAPIKRSDDDV